MFCLALIAAAASAAFSYVPVGCAVAGGASETFGFVAAGGTLASGSSGACAYYPARYVISSASSAPFEFGETPEDRALREAFEGIGTVIKTDDGYSIAITNDHVGTIGIPDNLGLVEIDLGGHSLRGDDGGAAIQIVASGREGDPTHLVFSNSNPEKAADIVGGEGGPGIWIADDAKEGVVVEIGAGVTLAGGKDGKPIEGGTATGEGTVVKAEVKVPSIADKTYNGEMQAADVSGTDRFTVTANAGGTNVGDYDVTLTLTDPANCKWPDSDEAAKTLKFSILPRSGVVVTIVGHSETVEFDGQTHTVSGWEFSCGDSLYQKSFVACSVPASVSASSLGRHAMGLTAAAFSNASANFSGVTFNVTDGALTIEVAEIPDGPKMLDPSAGGTVKCPVTPKVKGVQQEFLKGKATATWSAMPCEGCVFGHWEWTNGTPAAAFAALSENELKNPSLKLKIAEGELVRPTDVGPVWYRIDEDVLGEVTLTPSNLATESKSYVTAALSGLPNGLKFDKKTLAITGAAKNPGAKLVGLTAKNASGYTLKQSFLFAIAADMSVTVTPADDQVRTGVPVMLWCDGTMGTVKKSSVVALTLDKKSGVWSKKVSVSATAAKGYVFAGWYEEPTFETPATFWTGSGMSLKKKDYRETSQSITVTGPTYLFARFVEKTAKGDPIMDFKYVGAGYCGASASAEVETWYQGVALPTNVCAVSFDSASLPAVSVNGLPSGVKFDKATCRFMGAPTDCSTEKKPFFTLTVTVKNKSITSVLTKKVEVKALPPWAVGNFDGYHVANGATNGTFAATVGKAGKVSGKTAGGPASTSFSANCFSGVSLVDGALCYTADAEVKYKDPVSRKTMTEKDVLCLMEDSNSGLGVISGGDTDGTAERSATAEGRDCVGIQRAWERKDLAMPAFATGKTAPTLDLGNGIILKFGSKGKVSVNGTIGGTKVSGTTYALASGWTNTDPEDLLAQVCVYIAPKKGLESGFCAVYDVLLKVGVDGEFAEVRLIK